MVLLMTLFRELEATSLEEVESNYGFTILKNVLEIMKN